MSSDQKLLKVASLVLLAWSLVMLVFDAVAIVTVASMSWTVPGLLLVASYTFDGLFGFWVGMKGVRGANTPSRVGPFNVGSLVLAVFVLFCLAFTLVTGADFGGVALEQNVPMLILEVVAIAACIVGWTAGRRVLEAALNK